MNEEQKIIMKRCVNRLIKFSEIAIKRGEIKLARELDEECAIIHLFLTKEQ